MPFRYLLITMAVLIFIGIPSAQAAEIHEAIAAGDAARVQQMLRENPDLINERSVNATRDLPLLTAAIHGNVEIARILLDAGADINCGDIDESTPLGVAALNRHGEMVAFLLERGADVNWRDHFGGYPLSFAASGGDSAIVRQILDAGSDLNYLTPGGITLLHFAASRGLRDLFDLMIERGIDVSVAANNGATPLHWAAAGGRVEFAEMLIARGADPSVADTSGNTPLIDACWRGRVEIAKFFLDKGADANVSDENGWTALHAATNRNETEIVKALIAHGANVNAGNQNGEIPLVQAVDSGNLEMVQAYLAAGARTDAEDTNTHQSVLQIAALRGYQDVVEALVAGGAPINDPGAGGETPLQLASHYGHQDVVDLLKARGAAGSTADGKGCLTAQTEIKDNEAVVWYLGHSGWAIKTKEHFLIFDSFDQGREPSQPGLCNGHINPQEIAGENVMVLVSHEHGDHYDPYIFGWREQLPDISYVLGCRQQDQTGYEYIGPRQVQTIDGVKITTIESNDSGVGFVLEVDGMVIYHAGDHANRHQDFSGPYKAEIDYLKERGVRPDIAFMPISGCGFGDQVAVKMGVHYALETLNPKVFFPMHSGGNSQRYFDFIEECEDQFPQVRMDAPKNRGDHFRYSHGKIS
ncbi:MAG: ankyrin repeat domain-containing protein [Candidatus Eisenbacteria bacterium]|uniref:Ankyrin repeat domain-containing protein n=1 Tax=Eiseniibacteriota bacterium TaxID=2212470 RepID=A0A948RWT4_UNCEI|nr:ankyrin repeat domain-containing protein [Candidatus Eisenbacteria bacterium]MBU1950079.1 ankyrin repeat domain-containing protein [Candidatus Eisenbacteria bacterium]MBU2690992.1 ankyrin repeat domain-containing protein [Candidatus Eisenbacteria bacterium]